jgi:sulfite reductase (ferredoxin)
MSRDNVSPSRPARAAVLPAPLRGGVWEREIRTIEEQIARYEAGDLAEEKWKAFRLIHGIYGQRQPGIQMLRIKIPNGALNALQLEAVADVAEIYGHGLAHVTTRQDIQFHYVPLRDAPSALRRLAAAGIMSREACGNSVRNVTSCPHSGVHRDEPFAVFPYAQSVSRFLLRHPSAQLLGRKFKIALSGCPEDCAAGPIHDIGLLARLRVGRGGLERGFHVLVGGGLGATPFVAKSLVDFLPAENVLVLCEALVRLFSLHGNRRNRARARSKFVVADLGIDEFRNTYETFVSEIPSGREDLAVGAYLDPEELDLLREEWPAPAVRPLPQEPPDLPGANGLGDAYRLWLRRNTIPQRQPDLRAVTVPLPLGDIAPSPLRRLAAIARTYANDEVRTTISQNLLIRNVPTAGLADAFLELRDAGLADPVAGTALDVTSCPGADTCKLGITSSKGLARAIARELGDGVLPADDLAGVSIKISGCPNGCGQHHIGAVGLHGVARSVDGRQAPYYQLHLGGKIAGPDSRVAKGSLRIPAKQAPSAVKRILQVYLERRSPGEDLPDFLQRAEREEVASWLGPLAAAPPPETEPDGYRDWEQDVDFSTDGLGEGECAGAGVDLSFDPFSEATSHFEEARLYMEREQPWDAIAELNRGVFAAGRLVLVHGVKKSPVSDWETLWEFRSRFVDRGHASEAWNDLREDLDRIMSRKNVAAQVLPPLMERARAFLEECRTLLCAIAAWKEDPNAQPLPGLAPHGGGEPMS